MVLELAGISRDWNLVHLLRALIMKILHVANLHLSKYGSHFYCTDRKISNGLIRNGHFVYDFSYRDVARYESTLRSQMLGSAKMNRCLLQLCDNLEPDIILLGKSELIPPETLKKIRQRYPETKIALWHFDAIYNEQEINYIAQQLYHIHAAFFTTGGVDLARLREQHKDKIFFFPNPIDTSVETLKHFNFDNFEFDVIFCGRDKKRIDRRRYLERMIRMNQRRLCFSIHGALGHPVITGKDYMMNLRNSAMALNLSDRFDIEYYSSDRIAHLTGHGLCTFSPLVPKFQNLYSENELVYYESLDDLFEKLWFYKNNPDRRKNVAMAGWQRAHNDYSSTRVTDYFIDALYNRNLESYHWASY